MRKQNCAKSLRTRVNIFRRVAGRKILTLKVSDHLFDLVDLRSAAIVLITNSP